MTDLMILFLFVGLAAGGFGLLAIFGPKDSAYVARNAVNNLYAERYEKALVEAVRAEVLVSPGGTVPMDRMKEMNDATSLAAGGVMMDYAKRNFAFESWRVASERAWASREPEPATCDWCGSEWVADKFHPGSCGECGAGRET